MILSRQFAVLLFSSIAVLLPSATMQAQAQPLAQEPGARQFTFATGAVWTTNRRFKFIPAPTIDATYGWRVAGDRRLSVITGGYGGVSTGLPTGDVCEVTAQGGCRATMPGTGYVGADVAGLMQFRHASLSILSGPGLFFVQGGSVVSGRSQSGVTIDRYSGGPHFGLLTRAELTKRIAPRVGLALSGDVRVINKVFGERLVTKGGNFGIRVQ